MEAESYDFDELDLQIFAMVDSALENNDYKYQSDMILELVKRRMIDDFDVMRIVSVLASIVCDKEEDVVYEEETGLPSDDCVVMLFSEELEEMYYNKTPSDVILGRIESELLSRERYELLNELKKFQH